MKIKKKEVKKEEVVKKKEEPKPVNIVKPPEVKSHFETMDADMAYCLVAKGHKIKEVKSPFGGRGKLYIFHDDEKTIKGVKNV